MTDTTNTELATKFAEATDKVKGLGEELKGRMEKGEQSLSTLKSDVDEALTKFNELKSQVDELEQKASRRGGADEVDYRTIGQKMTESEGLKQLIDDPRGVRHAKMDVKATTITSATTAAAGSAGALINPQIQSGVIAPNQRRLTIRDLLMPGTTNSNAITYVRETGFTNSAGIQVKEGDKKPQSDIQFDQQTVNVSTIAHFVKASKQILNDAPMLASYIDGRLMYGLKYAEELQLLNGDGLNGNLKGIIPQATAFANPAASLTTYTIIDQLRLAMLQTALAEYSATGIVLNPIDWTTIELAKDNEARYIIGNPQSTATPTLWSLPVVQTQAMGVGKFLTGAFDLGAQIFDAETASIEVGFENDDFTRNLVTILCEERLALAVYRPQSFVYGTLAADTTP